jgi:hypothetical protein
MNKKELAILIDAYADAKASKNQHLLNLMVAQMEKVLDELFQETPSEPDKGEF